MNTLSSSRLITVLSVLSISLAAACGGGASGGGQPPIGQGGDNLATSDGGADAASYDPCAGKIAGDACTLCDPADTTCVETAVLKTCDAKGICDSATITIDAGSTYDPCAGKGERDACTLCDPADTTCVETADLKACFLGKCTAL